jgi:hypothetical protein
MDEEVTHLLTQIFNSSEPEKLITMLLTVLPKISKDSTKGLFRTVKDALFSHSSTTTKKLQSFRVLKALISTKIP